MNRRVSHGGSICQKTYCYYSCTVKHIINIAENSFSTDKALIIS